jgi:hypothetical protein
MGQVQILKNMQPEGVAYWFIRSKNEYEEVERGLAHLAYHTDVFALFAAPRSRLPTISLSLFGEKEFSKDLVVKKRVEELREDFSLEEYPGIDYVIEARSRKMNSPLVSNALGKIMRIYFDWFDDDIKRENNLQFIVSQEHSHSYYQVGDRLYER